MQVSAAMARNDHAAPPDAAGHQGSHTVPQDVTVPSEREGPASDARAREPRLNTDPPREFAQPRRRVDLTPLLAAVLIAVVIAALALFSFMTTPP